MLLRQKRPQIDPNSMFDFNEHLQHNKNPNFICTLIFSVLPSKILAALTHPWQQPKQHPNTQTTQHPTVAPSTSLIEIKTRDPIVAPTTSLTATQNSTQVCNYYDCTNHDTSLTATKTAPKRAPKDTSVAPRSSLMRSKNPATVVWGKDSMTGASLWQEIVSSAPWKDCGSTTQSRTRHAMNVDLVPNKLFWNCIVACARGCQWLVAFSSWGESAFSPSKWITETSQKDRWILCEIIVLYIVSCVIVL